MFTFNQRVMTPNGPAIFIGYLGQGFDVQVSRLVPASSMTKDECIRRKPNIVQMSPIDFASWQKTAKFCINEIYAAGEISIANQSSKSSNDDYTNPQQTETSEVAAGMPVTVRDITSDHSA